MPLSELKDRFGCRNNFDIRFVSDGAGLLWTLLQVVLICARCALFRRGALVYTRSAIASFFIAFLPVRLMVEQHAPPSSLRPRLRFAFLWLLRVRRFSRLVVISEKLKEIFLRQLDEARVRQVRMLVAHDGADAMVGWQPETPGGFVAGYAGHLYAGRGIDLIVKLAKQCADVRFLIAGGTDLDVAKWRGEAGLPENIEFLGGLPPKAVPDFLLSCHVLLAPYERKVFTDNKGLETSEWMSPLKVFEYMSAGRAIICSRMPVLEEVLIDGRTALLREPGDVQSWAQAVRALQADDTLRKVLGGNARSELEAGFTWISRARSILESV